MSRAMETFAGRLRSTIPTSAVPTVVNARYRASWRRPAVRTDAEEQMRFLLEKSRPELDVMGVAEDYVRFQALRGELRWHPELLAHLRVVGVEHLRNARSKGRGVVLNFMHHAHYEGSFASLAVQHGEACQMVVYPYMLEAGAPAWLRQHVRVASMGGSVPVSASIGTGGMLSLLDHGEAVAIASDVPGRTLVRFAGRDVLGSYGAARLAWDAQAPVVLLTNELEGEEPVVRVHPPLHPAGFESPRGLLDHMLSVHEAAILAWPEAADLPLSRWGTAEPA